MKILKPMGGNIHAAVARVPVKQADPAYLTTDWKALRAAVFERDGFKCVVPGCGRGAIVCEHIVSRRSGGADAMNNLCSLCRDHDNRFKEEANGVRRNADEWHRLFASARG